jgi:hypothetical protein
MPPPRCDARALAGGILAVVLSAPAAARADPPSDDGGSAEVIEVTGSAPAPAPAGSISLDAQVARQTAGALGEPLRALALLPGVATSIAASGYPVIRGTLPGESRYELDGIELPQLYHFLIGNQVIHPSFIDAIELRAGGHGAEHGHLIGGLIEMTASSQTTPRTELRANLAEVGAFRVQPLSPSTTLTTLRVDGPGQAEERIAERQRERRGAVHQRAMPCVKPCAGGEPRRELEVPVAVDPHAVRMAALLREYAVDARPPERVDRGLDAGAQPPPGGPVDPPRVEAMKPELCRARRGRGEWRRAAGARRRMRPGWSTSAGRRCRAGARAGPAGRRCTARRWGRRSSRRSPACRRAPLPLVGLELAL